MSTILLREKDWQRWEKYMGDHYESYREKKKKTPLALSPEAFTKQYRAERDRKRKGK